MYTQCNHCNAIFRVTMKELTAAQGLLRCGECDAIFDAMKTLSATLPEERRFAPLGVATPAPLPPEADYGKKSRLTLPHWENIFKRKPTTASRPTRPQRSAPVTKSAYKTVNSRSFLLVGIGALILLLLLQLLYSNRDWLLRQPATSALTHQVCTWLGCELTPPRDVHKINLLSRNVYSHPNTPDVLTISASIQNDAAFPQVYPLIEISFLNQKNEVLALRRFPPTEYIKNFNGELMPVGIPNELLLNISDPGEEAIRFQFRFM